MQTKFLLRGAHRTAKCGACHTHNVHAERLPVDCASCHRDDDPHKGRLGNTCTACHDESTWKPSHFDHDRNAFVLLGAHRMATRSEEHTSELQSLMRISYAVFCLKKTNHQEHYN